MSGTPEHIKPWLFKKGQSGNPKGRPRNVPQRTVAERIIELADEIKPGEIGEDGKQGPDLRGSDQLAQVFWNHLLAGDPRFWALASATMPSLLASVLPIGLEEGETKQITEGPAARKGKLLQLRRVLDDCNLEPPAAPKIAASKGNGAVPHPGGNGKA